MPMPGTSDQALIADINHGDIDGAFPAPALDRDVPLDGATAAVHATSAAAETAIRDRFREQLTYIKTASYIVPLEVIENVTKGVQLVHAAMAECMTADVEPLLSRRGGASRGEFDRLHN